MYGERNWHSLSQSYAGFFVKRKKESSTMVQVTVLNWAYEHYLYYLCLSIADTDCVISESDTARIKNELFPNVDSNRLQSLQREVYNEYLVHSEKERTEFIAANAARFLRTPAIRAKVISQLEALSGKEDENNPAWIMFRYIRKVINTLK